MLTLRSLLMRFEFVRRWRRRRSVRRGIDPILARSPFIICAAMRRAFRKCAHYPRRASEESIRACWPRLPTQRTAERYLLDKSYALLNDLSHSRLQSGGYRLSPNRLYAKHLRFDGARVADAGATVRAFDPVSVNAFRPRSRSPRFSAWTTSMTPLRASAMLLLPSARFAVPTSAHASE